MARRPCAHQKADGTTCQAPARKGGSICFMHDPGSRTAAQEARAAGGKVATWRPTEVVPASLERREDRRKLLEDCINRVRSGEMEPPQANAVASLINVYLRSEVQPDDAAGTGSSRPLKDMTTGQILALVEAQANAADGGH